MTAVAAAAAAPKHVLDASFYERGARAVHEEDFLAKFHYGWCWVDGLGTTPECDFSRARGFFRDCIGRGTEASRELVNIFFFRSRGSRFPPFVPEEVNGPVHRGQMQREMAIAADRGAPPRARMTAAFHVANRFWLGLGTGVNDSSAVAWMQAAAEMGHTMAMLRLAQMHLYGCLGIEHSVLAGAFWMFKCSKAPDAPPCALYHMGRIHVLGVETPPGSKNIPPNRDMAYSFFKQASKVHVDAALSLAILDRQRSPNTAWKWISLARRNPAFATARIFEVAGTIPKREARPPPPIPRPASARPAPARLLAVPPPPVPPRRLSIVIPKDDDGDGDDTTGVHCGERKAEWKGGREDPKAPSKRREAMKTKDAPEPLPVPHSGIRSEKTRRRRVFLKSYR